MPRKALLLGNNYSNTSYSLKGCVNDIVSMKKVLVENNFSQITMISDDRKVANISPTKKNIISALTNLVTQAQPGDTLFFHYSGHGTAIPDTSGDEFDRQDEAIVANDQIITDDEIKSIVNKLPLGVKLFALMDSCNSGTVFDLVHNLDKKSTLNLSVPGYKEKAHGYTVMISGCRDDQTSADAYFYDKSNTTSKKQVKTKDLHTCQFQPKSEKQYRGKYHGALTVAFLDQVNNNGLNSIFSSCFNNETSQMEKLRNNLIDWLEDGGFDQRPNISFEGFLPNEKIVHSYNVGKYNLRQVKAREEKDYNKETERYFRLA